MDEHRLKLQKEVETQANNAHIELEKLAKRQAGHTDKEVGPSQRHTGVVKFDRGAGAVADRV